MVAKKLNKLEEMYGQNAQEKNTNAENKTQAKPNVNKVSNIDHILYCSKVHYSFENYKSKGSTIEFSQAVVEEYVKFISENENSKKLIEEIKKLRERVTFTQVDNTQKFIDENNEVGIINNYLLYIQEYFAFTSNVLSDLNELSEKEKSEGGDRLVEGQLKRIEKILKKNAQSQNERSQRRVHFSDDISEQDT
ncbi:MAG: hypothetical protein PG981_001180 [Wolbachia endosymbiont of Ctenocephalides orientis wCori]|nr:MAG: hypothetical protein PG981_001180 [Wolbachia endosymbiont of Ctenocephalides orientis wCori]